MGKHDNGEDGSQVEVIMPDGFGSSFSTQQIRAKVFRNTVNSRVKKVHYSFLKSRVVWFKKDLCT